MADDVSPDQTRARQFDVVRRGYDRAQVDAYLDELSREIVTLEETIDKANVEALAVGIDDQEALANELHKVGGEISAILEAARAAAEGLRSRAVADADTWRSEAEAETSSAISSAKEQTQALRSSAWNEGTALINSALAEAKRIMAAAQEDALFMRAEAERDALRLTSDARRDKEEALRAARQEAELILGEARAESDGVLAAAQKQAELAQERARALEDRRSELLAELEATRASIGLLEDEIDSRRQELEAPVESEPDPDEQIHQGLDVGSVRIVAASSARTLKPVDPDELVAEVTAMRASKADREATQRLEPDTVAVIAPPDAVPDESDPDEQDVSEEASPAFDQSAATETTPPPGPTEQPPPPQPSAEPVTTESVAPPQREPQPPDEIGSLFAALRSSGDPEPSSGESVATGPASEPDQPTVTAGSTRALSPSPAPAPTESTSDGDADDEVTTIQPEATDAAVLGARNAALKDIKRSLVDLQNEALEALRTDEDWVPDDHFMNRFEAPFVAVGDVTGAVDPSDAAGAFASDLHDSVLSALEEARALGKGSRAVAAAASKVFRTWRSDEAERRLQRLETM